MSRPSARSTLCGVMLVALGITGCVEHPHGRFHPRFSAGECDFARNHGIWVFDDGSVTEECAAISKMANHRILWVAASPDAKSLSVDLVVRKGQEVPFEGIRCDSANPHGDVVCHFDCKKDRCRTGAFRAEYHPNPAGDYYTYSSTVQLLTGELRKGADPGMRIDP